MHNLLHIQVLLVALGIVHICYIETPVANMASWRPPVASTVKTRECAGMVLVHDKHSDGDGGNDDNDYQYSA